MDFDELLHKKLIGKTEDQQKALRCYYRKKYKETGQIPEALITDNAMKLTGRKKATDDEAGQRFIEMVKASAADISDPYFVPKRLRKIRNFRKLLEAELGRKIPKDFLYRLAKEQNLYEFLDKPDFDDKYVSTGKNHFRSVQVFDLIQIDGCVMKYLKIKNDSDEWASPAVISFMDTGSRFIFNMHLCFTESNQSSVEAFGEFMRSTLFPNKVIKLRPDNSGGFLNLKRPIHELNQKYSTLNGLLFDDDFARVLKAKDKIHLERSHKTLHNFEFFMIQEFTDRITLRQEGTKFFSGKMEKTVISHISITLSELKASGIIEKYRDNHNSTSHIFTDDGQRIRWTPQQKLDEFMYGVETTMISEKDIQSLNVYGHRKNVISAPKARSFVYHGRQYFIHKEVSNFWQLRRMDKVRVSEDGDQLFIFEDRDNGTLILTAFATQSPVRSEKAVKEKDAKKKTQNQTDLITALLENNGMVLNKSRLLREFENGLTLEISEELVKQHTDKYSKYTGDKGFIAFNLFLADFINYNKAEVKPYADLRRVA
jgi:hypothetical protein